MVEAYVNDLPDPWWPVMPWVKVAATAGLVAGLWVPYVGALTSAALVVYFVLAVSAHIRARDIGRNLALNATLSLVLCVAVFVFCLLGLSRSTRRRTGAGTASAR